MKKNFPNISNVFPEERRHYVTLFVVARSDKGEAKVCEPARCEAWQWFRWSDLPRPLFPPLESLLQTGFVPEKS